MRALGYAMVDLLVGRTDTLDESRVWRGASRAEMESRLREGPPAGPTDMGELFRRLEMDILPFTGQHDHPRFFGYTPSCPTWPGVLGDFLASGANIFAGTWLQSAGPSTVELIVLDWFRQWIGYGPQASGILLPGGSLANLTAVACARETQAGGRGENAVVYVTSQCHSSMTRGLKVLGFKPEQVRSISVDERLRMRPDALAAAIETDVQAGRQPFLASPPRARRTPARSIRSARSPRSARERDVWLHVDAAYGGFAMLTERGQRTARGDRPGGLGHARPAQVALPAVRVRLPDRPQRPAARAGVPRHAGLPPGHGRRRRRGQLRRPRHPAHPRRARAEALAVAPVLRRGRVPRGDRPLARPRPHGRGADRGLARSSSCCRRPRSASCASAAGRPAWTTSPTSRRSTRI